MFKLRGKRTVARDCRPAVRQRQRFVRAQIDHRFDGEEHSLFKFQSLVHFAVIQHVRSGVENASQAVPAIILDDGTAVLFGEFLHGVPDVAQSRALFDLLDAAHHRFIGDVDQPFGFDGQFADAEHAGRVAVPAV